MSVSEDFPSPSNPVAPATVPTAQYAVEVTGSLRIKAKYLRRVEWLVRDGDNKNIVTCFGRPADYLDRQYKVIK